MQPEDLYDYIYSHLMPNRGLYGANCRRDGAFIKYFDQHIPTGSSVLDAGCGRGTLLRWLISADYKAEGTEIADCLLSPGGELYGMPVKKMFYDELINIPYDEYDAVVSNDVLEHLHSEIEVINAVENLARIAKKWLLVSTGGLKQAANPFRLETGVTYLHNVVKPLDWWQEIYRRNAVPNYVEEVNGTLWLFGEVI